LAHSCLTLLDVLLVSAGFFCLFVCSFLLSSAVQHKACCCYQGLLYSCIFYKIVVTFSPFAVSVFVV
jgi:hypothetical protein